MNSDDNVFKAVLQMLVPQLVRTMMVEYGMKSDEALRELYGSRLYSDLERESSKLWHLSPLALCDLWHEEKMTGEITYPEEA